MKALPKKFLRLILVGIAVTSLFSVPLARASIIPIGQVTFTGDFILNHLYDFNNPGAQPFGWFQIETVSKSSGIFSGHVHAGDILQGAGALNTVHNLPLFSLGGLQFVTSDAGVSINGPDSGRLVSADVTIVGLDGFTSALWSFTAPPYDISNFPEDITGPIELRFSAFFDNGHVPDTGNTLTLLGFATSGLLLIRRKKRFLLDVLGFPQIADSNSRNAVSVPSARTTKCFP